MHKFEKFKYFATGCIMSAVLITGTGSVFAEPISKDITALYSNIKIYVDGILIQPKDANGEKVEPFVYNGTTYLPVRAVGEALGKTVKWRGETQSVYLGAVPEEQNYLLNVVPPYQSDYVDLYKGEDGNTFSMAGKKYSNGFTMGNYSTKSIYFNLDGKYSEITGIAGMVGYKYTIPRKFDIYIDGELYKSVEIKADSMPEEIKIPVKGALQLKIVSPYDGTGGSNGDTYIGFGDIKIK